MNTTFAHVKDERLRRLLRGDVSEDALCIALVETREAAEADLDNELVPCTVARTRMHLIEEAEEAWNECGDMAASLDYLRQYWSL